MCVSEDFKLMKIDHFQNIIFNERLYMNHKMSNHQFIHV